MANEKNLTPFTSDQSHEEAVKNGKKGGVASGAARRRKKTMRQTLNVLLSARKNPQSLHAPTKRFQQ